MDIFLPYISSAKADDIIFHRNARTIKCVLDFEGKRSFCSKRNVLVEYGNPLDLSKSLRNIFCWKGAEDPDFEQADFLSLTDYMEQKVTDLPYVITSITIGGQTKTVNHYHGDDSAPQQLTDLESKIDEIVNSKQWTGK